MMNAKGALRWVGVGFAVAGALTGCATSFTGEAHVPGGPAGCRDVCASYGMELAGMVAMGEYSDGCICRVRSQVSASGSDTAAVAGAAPAAVGVVMAMRARQQQAQQHH